MAASVALFILAASVYQSNARKQVQRLVLINERMGNTLLSANAPDGTDFSISYIHSVNKSPVTEYFKIIDGKIYLMALRFESFGAGMPTELDPMQSITYENGNMLISGFNRHLPNLCVFISRSDGQFLEIGDVSISLKTLDKPGEPIAFIIEK